MNNFNINTFIRNNIKALTPYSSARKEFKGQAAVFLDANENSFGSPIGNTYNRYPDPLQLQLKQKISELKQVDTENIFIGNGSDEAIDLLFRAFCNPGKDNIIICPPTYGMYEVSANINDIEVREVLLTKDFQFNVAEIIRQTDKNTKMVFLCSPNNPTGNSLKPTDIETLLNDLNTIVVVDEAYIDFSSTTSWLERLKQFPNLVILQTLSKAWGLAGLRIGFAFASNEIINVLNSIKPPYNIGAATQKLTLKALNKTTSVNNQIQKIIKNRTVLTNHLSRFAFVKQIFNSDANFILIRVVDANKLYNYLTAQGIVVRNRSSMPLCDNCLRITVGTQKENTFLIQSLKQYEKENIIY